MEKTLEYYLNLSYLIELTAIPDHLGGGFTVCLPEIGRLALVGDGKTINEALKDLEKAKRERFTSYLKKGIEIPEPE